MRSSLEWSLGDENCDAASVCVEKTSPEDEPWKPRCSKGQRHRTERIALMNTEQMLPAHGPVAYWFKRHGEQNMLKDEGTQAWRGEAVCPQLTSHATKWNNQG